MPSKSDSQPKSWNKLRGTPEELSCRNEWMPVLERIISSAGTTSLILKISPVYLLIMVSV